MPSKNKIYYVTDQENTKLDHEYVLDCKDVQLGVGEIETEITPLTETD